MLHNELDIWIVSLLEKDWALVKDLLIKLLLNYQFVIEQFFDGFLNSTQFNVKILYLCRNSIIFWIKPLNFCCYLLHLFLYHRPKLLLSSPINLHCLCYFSLPFEYFKRLFLCFSHLSILLLQSIHREFLQSRIRWPNFIYLFLITIKI